ncbi:hypothetical protein M408DRAFT_29599 [Serendipita vermifera MAFF 305830]|uniref:Uncharacterized protein n=1 Tax=Serendipita vermifera MAFF 305830 TaxID=933852 RepID=A0A0C3AMZ3_SERVB|nr:hypothetical protein M408DRAFT_29599 [Serendipita vermifera MAFF 305830]
MRDQQRRGSMESKMVERATYLFKTRTHTGSALQSTRTEQGRHGSAHQRRKRAPEDVTIPPYAVPTPRTAAPPNRICEDTRDPRDRQAKEDIEDWSFLAFEEDNSYNRQSQQHRNTSVREEPNVPEERGGALKFVKPKGRHARKGNPASHRIGVHRTRNDSIRRSYTCRGRRRTSTKTTPDARRPRPIVPLIRTFLSPYSFSYERVFSRDFRQGMSRHQLGDLDRRLELHEASKDSEQRVVSDQTLVQYRKKGLIPLGQHASTPKQDTCRPSDDLDVEGARAQQSKDANFKDLDLPRGSHTRLGIGGEAKLGTSTSPRESTPADTNDPHAIANDANMAYG